jgi:queuine tRNA-ribosyltransferase
MALDVCPPATASTDDLAAACALTTRWLDRTLAARTEGPLLFGIAQGGTDASLRPSHLDEIASRPVDGLALGGLSVGEDADLTRETVALSAPRMPADRPRYLMGMGTPADILDAVSSGIDLFDCVLPTRNARNGQVFTSRGRYSIKWSCWRDDPEPLDPACSCPTCRTFDRRYLRHLFVAGEILSARLLTLHNLTYYGSLMKGLRDAIRDGRLEAHRTSLVEGWARGPGGAPEGEEDG